ncbi:MAG: GNAT family N-acetyltransferase [Gemmatimonadales bacterium]
MARTPAAPYRVTGAPDDRTENNVKLLAGDAVMLPWIEHAVQLIQDAFPRPSMEITAALLRWHLTGVRFGTVRPLAAAATLHGRLIGFAGATPRPLRCGGHTAVGHVVSFVSVAASERGQGVAAQLYDRLLQALAAENGAVLTFAADAGAGMAALERAYPRNGFSGHSLGWLAAFGVLRRGVRSDVAPAVSGNDGVLTLADDERLGRHLDLDPRGSARVGSAGARAVAAWRLTNELREPLLLLEGLPSPLDSNTLRNAVVAAFEAFPDHAKLLVVPNYPVAAAAVAAAVGLRRLAGPTYRAWIWSREAGDPLLKARSTAHPVL